MGGAQIMLKWLRTGAWPKFTDILAAIRQELQSVQPIDTASIRWEKDAEGMRAYYTGRAGGGEGLTVDEGGDGGGEAEGYKGFFHIIDASTEEAGLQIKVVDGTETLGNGRCGLFVSGIDAIYVNDAILPISQSSYVIFNATYTPLTEETPAYWTVWLSLSPIIPTLTASSFVAVVGYAEVDGGKVSNIKQIYNDGVLYNNRYS